MTPDVTIVGAGAAGVAAAVVAARSGCSVVVIDNGQAPGGQYYRGAKSAPATKDPSTSVGKVHQVDESAQNSRRGLTYEALRRAFDDLVDRQRIDVRFGTTAYAIEGDGPGFVVRLRGDDRNPGFIDEFPTRALVIATGAFDRHLPFPGWDLPGVMSGGAAQALVKGSGVLPGSRIVVAGTGPFLLAVSHALLAKGASIAAVIEANDPIALARHTRAVLPVSGKSGELARFIASLARHRVPYLRRHRVRRGLGGDCLRAVEVSRVDADWHAVPGSERTFACDALAIGYGFTAQTDLLLQVGAATRVGADGGLAVVVDDSQQTSVAGLFAAGETTGVGGVDLARMEGLLAGAAAVEHCGRTSALTASGVSTARRDVGRLRAFADALHAAFPVRDGWRDDVSDDTIVCRCEEVDAGQVRRAVDELGATDARAVKLLTRAGMGWCQGRVCGPAVDRLCGFEDARSLAGASYRPVAIPVPLGALAGARMGE